MSQALVADTGGLLRALANGRDGKPAWPEYASALTKASAVIVPPLILVEVDYFLRDQRGAARKLIAEILDPATTYELEPILPEDLARAVQIEEKFADQNIGLVDGTVAAIAERRQVHRILTIDVAHFRVLRVGNSFRQALTIVP